MHLTGLDWTIIVAYFAITIGIGVVFSRRAGQSMSEFFVSGRSLPWWLAGTSMVATTFAADTPLAVTGLVAKHGIAGNWFWWAFALGGMVTVFVYARLWRRAAVLTDVELVELRYAGRPAAALRGLRALYVALLVNPIIIGWVTKAMLDVLKYTVLYDPLAGDTAEIVAAGHSDWLILLFLFAAVGIYCTLAGMWGVAVTDFLQFWVAMGACVALAVVAVGDVGGIAALKQQVAGNFGGGEQAFRMLPDFRHADPWLPLHVFLIMLCVQWWATWYPGAEPGGGGYVVQRMAACRDERHALLATLWYQVAHYCVRPWPWLLIALVALARYPELREMQNPGVGFPMVMRDLAPPGLRGLMLVAFFAAFMSTISTQMNWGASYLVRDVYQRFYAPHANDRQLAAVSRTMSVFVLLVGAVAAYLMRDISVDRAWKLLAALGAGTGAVYLLRWFWWRINAWSEITAMLSSLGYFVLAQQLNGRWGREWALEEIMAMVAVATILTWLAVTWLTPPEQIDTLKGFYRLAHPAGPGWRPMRALLPDVKPDQHLGLMLLAALLAGVLVYAVLFGIGYTIFGEYRAALLALVVTLVCGGGVAVIVRRTGTSVLT